MSLFSIGLSGMHAAQNALLTTGNNINNAFTPGYNREITQLAEQDGRRGVTVVNVERQFDRYVSAQLNDATSASTALKTYDNQISQIDDLLADREAGLAPLIQSFFSSLEDLASAPSDPAARQGTIGNADTLSAQFRSFDAYLEDMQQGINGQIKDEVVQINNQTKQLAQLNREIGLARARSGEAPNSLLNQRDQVVAQLSERLDVKLSVQDGKSYNLTLSSGEPLVTGTRSFSLEAMASSTDPERIVVGVRDAGGNAAELAPGTISGGTLGGLTHFRSETLDDTQNQLGRLAISLAEGFNEQHRKGADLNGNLGEDMFKIGDPQAFASDRNGGRARVDSIAIDDYKELRATDYEIRINDNSPADASGFTIQRKDNGQKLEAGSDFTFDSANRTLSFGGVKLGFDGGTLNQGDRFEVQPVRHGAGGMENRISELDKIAAGIPDADNGTGDNRNALELQSLQNEKLVGGNASVNQAYSGLISDVGNRTSVIKVNLDAKQGLTEQLYAVQQSQSGVNLNDEAANLLRYQQFYQANAKVIEIGSTVIDTILGLRT
ncbi:flagellar hook-associated protein FlgK [Pistricoccus aurantiacus]|uniref:Flagellar hook-associated protein 1 n=1 Tax=Pistricoccus aurantiacus TaxID=1883414 RepID=A0A5B8SXY3_9GAMM|nr:flagellar hook-associated protein FlgK [Pistricoccus aurantiacus]QEA39693.1 flagellar hook-associated protein FlgK [Pistricoccus aurantiacus]